MVVSGNMVVKVLTSALPGCSGLIGRLLFVVLHTDDRALYQQSQIYTMPQAPSGFQSG